MADLSDIQAAGSTKIVGSDSTGLEQTPVQSTANGELKVVDGLRNGGVYGALNIPTANTPVEAKAGGARLANRKFLQVVIENNGIFWGFDSSVTTTSGLSTSNGQVLTWAIDPASTFQVWLVGNANNKNVHVVEAP